MIVCGTALNTSNTQHLPDSDISDQSTALHDPPDRQLVVFITSRVSGWGNRISPVFPSFRLSVFLCFCLSVRLSVRQRSHIMWRHRMMSWHHRMISNNESMAKTTMTYAREVRERWGIFILYTISIALQKPQKAIFLHVLGSIQENFPEIYHKRSVHYLRDEGGG